MQTSLRFTPREINETEIISLRSAQLILTLLSLATAIITLIMFAVS